MSISETARSLASLIKTLISTGLICLVGYVGGWLYINFNPQIQLQQKEHELQQARASLATAERQLTNQNAMIKSLGEDLEASQKRVVQLDTSLRLLKVTHRVAEITVLSQQQLENGQLVTEFQFQEMNDQGVPIDRRHTFKIEGDLLYLDYWVVKFDDQYIEQADLDRSSSICLFRRMFGEHQEPYEGYVVDEVGVRPNAYGRGGVISEFERQILDRLLEHRQRSDAGRRHGHPGRTWCRPGHATASREALSGDAAGFGRALDHTGRSRRRAEQRPGTDSLRGQSASRQGLGDRLPACRLDESGRCADSMQEALTGWKPIPLSCVKISDLKFAFAHVTHGTSDGQAPTTHTSGNATAGVVAQRRLDGRRRAGRIASG